MNHFFLAGGLAITSLLLPPSFAAGIAAGDHSAAEVAKLVDSVVKDISADTVYECTCSKGESTPEECASQNAPAAKFVKLLSLGDDGALAAIKPLAVDALRSKDLGDNGAEAFIVMFLESRNVRVTPIAEAMHAAAPRRFSARALLGFCELGSEELVGPLTARVKKGDAGVTSAAYLAFSGHKAGRKILKKAVAITEVSAETALDALVAGHALRRLGDKTALAQVQGAVHAATLKALDAGDLEAARRMAVAASVTSHAMRSSQPTLSLLGMSCEEAVMKAAKYGKLASADQIFELIEEATPAG